MLRKTMLVAVMSAAFAVVGCAKDKPETVTPAPAEGVCKAEPVQSYIGKNWTTPVQDNVRLKSGATKGRVIKKGDAVTMDYNPARINVHIDEHNRITEITCG